MRVLITGVNGQMGSLMGELVSLEGEEVYGFARALISDNFDVLKDQKNFHLIQGDITNEKTVNKCIEDVKPHIIFNFAAISSPKICLQNRNLAINVNVFGLTNILDSVAEHTPTTCVVNMGSTREFFESNFYGETKRMAREHIDNYVKEGLRCSQPYLSLNDSERRIDENFVSAKIAKGLKRINYAINSFDVFDPIELGNIDQNKYWGYSPDFVSILWNMYNIYQKFDSRIYQCRLKRPAILGNIHTVREFIEIALNYLHFTYIKNEDGWFDLRSGRPIILVDSSKYAGDSDDIINIRKSFTGFTWANKTGFKNLVKRMI